MGNIYQQAHKELVARRWALTLEQKLQVVRNLEGVDVEVGLSGGDLLLNPDNLEVLRTLSEQIDGKQNIGLTTTNLGLRLSEPSGWLPHIAQVEVTYDSPVARDPNHQQPGYNSANYRALCDLVGECGKYGVNIKALVPISRLHTDPKMVEALYSELNRSGVPYVYLMRTLPVGRASGLKDEPLTANELRGVISKFREQKQTFPGGPEVQLMCGLRLLLPNEFPGNQCSVGKTTVDITTTGKVIVDAFAYGPQGQALFPEAILGDLTRQKLTDIISTAEAQRLSLLNDQNVGHCRVAAYINSEGPDNFKRFFGPTDPLISG
jgi:hypothetical protein